MQGHVYLLASRRNGTLYCGVTNDLGARVFAHRTGKGSGFTAKFGVNRLVWYETYDLVTDAIQRESNINIGHGVGNWP